MKRLCSILATMSVLSIANQSGAIMTAWSVQSASSSLTIAGAVSSGGTFLASLGEQGPGSLTTTYGGTIDTTSNLSGPVPTDLEIVGSELIANISGNWDPLLTQAPGNAPANYGYDVFLGFGGVRIAIRDLTLEFLSAGVPLSGSPFSTQSFSALISGAATDGTGYYRSYGGIGSIWPPPQPVDGPLGDFNTNGTISYGPGGNAGIATLTIPVNVIFVTLAAGGDTTTTSDDIGIYQSLIGQFVATAPTATVPEASSLVLLGLVGSVVGFAGYRRKRKT